LQMYREVSDTENDLRRVAVQLGTSSMSVDGYWEQMLTQTPVPASFVRLLHDGPELPWLTVLRQTSPNSAWLGSSFLALGLILAVAAASWGVWRLGARAERR